MTSSELKRLALDRLKGNWSTAVLAGLVASIFGALGTGGSFSIGGLPTTETPDAPTVPPSDLLLDSRFIAAITTVLAFIGIIMLIGFVYAIISFVIGGAIGVGYAEFNLGLADGKSPDISTLFGRFNMLRTALGANAYKGILVFLWTLLFIIPGIIASYDYAMTSFVMAEKPNLNGREVLAESKRIMRGNRFRLFCLELSFLGWSILCIFTLGIGLLWLVPYMQTTLAAFYRDITSNNPDNIEEQKTDQGNSFYSISEPNNFEG